MAWAFALSFLSSCFDDVGFLKQQRETDEGGTLSSEVLQNSDGILVAKIVASSNQVQLIQASEESNISGSSLTVPPGSFSIDTEISVQEGASLVSETLSAELGLDQDQQLTLASPAVVVSASEEVELNQPFTLSIALTTSSLRLFNDLEYTVIYKVQKSGENGAYSLGVIPSELLSISDGKAIFQAQFFGSYQVASSPKKITEAKEISVASPILTVEAAKTLPEIVWTVDEPRYDAQDRVAFISANGQGLKEPYSCHVFVDADMSAPWDFVEKVGANTKFLIKGNSGAQHERLARFVCTDETGRTSSSPWSKAAKFLALTAEVIGLPVNTTTALEAIQGSVTGLGVATYRYVFINAANSDCAKATFGAWQQASSPLTLSMTSDGPKTLCLQGQDRGQNIQVVASKVQWVVDRSPPGSFSLSSPSPYVNILSPIVQWSAAAGAAQYSLKLSQVSTCAAPTLNTTLTSTSYSLSTLSPGAYFLCLHAVDAVGNVTPAANSPFAFTIDTLSPQITSVTSTLANGLYPAGTIVPISVTFSEVVNLGAFNGGLSLQLETGTIDRMATYVSGSGTSTLQFQYTVQEGDNSPDLSVHASTPQVVLGGSQSLNDLAGNPASLSITGNPLGDQHAIAIDGIAPTASVAGHPTILSGPTNINVSVSGTDVSHYRFKLGGSSGTNCVLAQDYGAEFAVASNITASTGGITDTSAKLCVIGRDQAGNWQSPANATSVGWNHDGIGPSPGNSGLLNSTYKTESSISLSWSPASEPNGLIDYKVVYSMTNNIQNVADAQSSNASVLSDWSRTSPPITKTGLPLGTKIYFNVLAKDQFDNISAYQSILFSLPNKVSGIGRAYRTVTRSQSGVFLYAVDNHNKLLIYSLADPASPALLGSLDGFYYARKILEYDANRLLIADGYAGLKAVDISTPTNPTLTNTVAMPLRSIGNPGYVEDVAFYGNFVFAADPLFGVATIDATNMNNPNFVTTPISSTTGVNALAISNSSLLINVGALLKTYDISNIPSITNQGQLNLSSSANDIISSGNSAFVATNAGLKIVDISNINIPFLIATLGNSVMQQSVLLNGKIYVASATSGTQIYDHTDHSLLGSFPSSYARAVVAYDDHMYVADQSDGLAVVDILSAPSLIRWIGGKPGSAVKTVKSGNYAFVADNFAGITVVDVSDPEFPNFVTTIPLAIVYDLQLFGTSLYVAAGTDGVKIYSIADPEVPTLAGTFASDLNVKGVLIQGGQIYVAHTTGLKIFDTTTLNLLGFITGPSSTSIALFGNYAYLAAGNEGVSILDVSNPAGIISFTALTTGITPVSDVKVGGGKIFVSSSRATNGIFVFGLSNPTVPNSISISGVQLPYVSKVETIGNHAYFFAGKTVKVLDYSNAGNVIAVGSYTSPGYLYGITIDSGLAYLANYEYGLSIMEHFPGMPDAP